MPLTERVRDWRERGADEDVDGRRIQVFRRDGRDPVLLLLHGFPSSSYDWRLLLEHERDHAVIAFDCLGFGLSEKPRRHDYTLTEQADIAETLLARFAPGRPVFAVGHDMGTSVATELFARDIESSLGADLRGALLFNGSMIQGAASPTPAQRLLRGPLGPVAARLSSERFFRHQFGSVFSAAHPLTDAEAEDQWSLICAGGGRTLGHRLISYMDERERRADRWLGAIRDWNPRHRGSSASPAGRPPLRLAWGMRDPVATTAVLDAVLELRPDAPLTRLEEVGHYPQIEDPDALAGALRGALEAV